MHVQAYMHLNSNIVHICKHTVYPHKNMSILCTVRISSEITIMDSVINELSWAYKTQPEFLKPLKKYRPNSVK